MAGRAHHGLSCLRGLKKGAARLNLSSVLRCGEGLPGLEIASAMTEGLRMCVERILDGFRIQDLLSVNHGKEYSLPDRFLTSLVFVKDSETQ